MTVRVRFRLDRKLATARQDEQPAVCAGMLDGGAQQRVDQLLEHDLARSRLRDLEDRREVQMLDGRPDGALRIGRQLLRAEMGMKVIELPHLTVGTPAQIAVPCLPQIHIGDPLDSARRVEARGELARERLVVDESVRPRRSDRPLVEAHRVGMAALDARDLGADEYGAVLEVRWAVLGPLLELAMVSCQCLLVPGAFRGGCRIAERSPRQRGVELVVCQLECFRRRPKKSSRVFCRFDGGDVRTREEARLQLADEVPAGDESQPRILRQMLLEPALVELGIVERVELRGQAEAALELTQAALLHQVQAELSEAEAGLVVAETMAEEHA